MVNIVLLQGYYIIIYLLVFKIIEKQRKTSVFRKLFLYPTFMLLLLALTVVTVLLVVQNLLLIFVGIKALPLNTRVSGFVIYMSVIKVRIFKKNVFFSSNLL